MEKYPLKGNNKSIALQSLVGSSNKNLIGSSSSGNSSTGVTYQSVSKKALNGNRKVQNSTSLSIPSVDDDMIDITPRNQNYSSTMGTNYERQDNSPLHQSSSYTRDRELNDAEGSILFYGSSGDGDDIPGIGQYEDFHTIDWQRDIARDRMRHRYIVKKIQDSVWDFLKLLLHFSLFRNQLERGYLPLNDLAILIGLNRPQ